MWEIITGHHHRTDIIQYERTFNYIGTDTYERESKMRILKDI